MACDEALVDYKAITFAEQKMPTQSVCALQKALITQLNGMGYGNVTIKDNAAMLANLKRQLEVQNKNITFTQAEFRRILNHLNTGSIFNRAKILRDMFALRRDDDEVSYIGLFNAEDLCLNQFQVASQVIKLGNRKKRYDVTLIINGLPLVQVELLKNNMELRAAFHHVNRYEHNSYDAEFGLFQYVQLFIISNGVDTKYFANNQHQSFQQTFYWIDKGNKCTSDLHEFCSDFFKPCNIAKMLIHFMVMTDENVIKVLCY